MAEARRLRILIVTALLLPWPAALGQAPQAWAQPQQTLDGIYRLVRLQECKGDNCTDSDQMALAPKLLYITKTVYFWVDADVNTPIEYSEYQLTKPMNFTLCASKWLGEWRTPRVTIRTPDQYDPINHINLRYVYSLERMGPVVGNPRVGPNPTRCSTKRSGPAEEPLTATAVHGWPLLARLQTQAAARRVNGQFLLAVKDDKDHPATAVDKDLWSCLVTKGYPRVMFLEDPSMSSSPDQTAYVWPDGHFQGVFQNGAIYDWRVRSSGCGTEDQDSANRFMVPKATASTEEKIVLACFISERRFSECDSWWLRRP